ncbi:MAG TPA: phosphatase PAP2 family protein [Baekduia sp.]|nr:phosphatase PAP2 family protein [Baekduia sp.]
MLRRPGPPLALALAGVLLLAATGVLAKAVPWTRAGDQRTLKGFVSLPGPRLSPLLDHVAHLADPGPYALAGLVLALIALARGRWRSALVIPPLFVATGLTTEVLKHVLASPRYDEWLGARQIAEASWPSGHSTAAMTVALCAVLAVPPRLRPTAAALGGAFTVAVAFAILALGWHFPSDVLGGFLVAAVWVLLALSALAAVQRRWPTRLRAEAPPRPSDALPAMLVALLAAGLAVGLAVTRPREIVGYASDHTTFVVGALLIAAAAIGLAALLAVGVRGSRSAAR